ncbi:MAG: HAD family hydrolase [Oscillospiraceae bacterium]
MLKTVLFDLDGTLLPFVQDDFIKLYFGGLCRKLAPLGYQPDKTVKDIWAGTKAMVMNDGSKLNKDAFWEVFRAANAELPDAECLCDDFYTSEFDAVKACLKSTPDHKPMISRLKEMGLEIVLATNPVFPKCAVDTRLKWVNLDESDFSYISSYENSTASKPNPAYFSEILRKIGRQPDECVMIGNSASEDYVPASRLGIPIFLVSDFLENTENIDISGCTCGTMAEAEEFVKSLV